MEVGEELDAAIVWLRRSSGVTVGAWGAATESLLTWFKVLYAPSLAGPEDWGVLGMHVLPPWEAVKEAIEQRGGVLEEEVPHPMTSEWAEMVFEKGDVGRGAIIQLTLPTVSEVLGRASLAWEKRLLCVNRGHMQWSVAAMLLGLNCLTPPLLRFVLDAGMIEVPLAEWRTSLAEWFTAVRRCPILPPGYDAPMEQVVRLRKAFNMTWRDLSEADWEAEECRRTVNTPVHWLVDHEGFLSRRVWLERLQEEIDAGARQLVGQAVRFGLEGIREWWDGRWAHTPGGSSANRWRVGSLLESDPRLGSGDRPNKKAVFETLPEWWPVGVVESRVPCHVARASTKPEPGGKARAIYAVDDDAFIVSSYASQGMEKCMDFWGMKAKQMPADVVAWKRSSEVTEDPQCWLSLDYSDYNSEHEADTLTRVNLALARAWTQSAAHPVVRAHKSMCSVWVAAAHQTKFVVRGDVQLRVWAGLFSGDRDTARDNTFLHAVYSRMASWQAKQMYGAFGRLESHYTGDDEDSKMRNWQSSAMYLLAHSLMGFSMKPEKQMGSRLNHEFLQRMVVKGMPLERPIFTALAQLASGNWYTDVHVWYDSAIQSVSDNIWELVTRGMPLVYGRRLAVSMLNAVMRVPLTPPGSPVTTWKKLEWWVYRHGSGSHPLWTGTEGDSLPMPVVPAKPTPGRAACTGSTDAWVEGRKDLLAPIADSPGWELYREGCLKESYAGLYARERAAAHAKYAREIWPERWSEPMLLNAPGPVRLPPERLNALILSQPAARRPASENEVLARIGLDARLVAALGGLHAVLRAMAPNVLSRYSMPRPEVRVPGPIMWEDSALRSWWNASALSQVGTTEAWEKALSGKLPSVVLQHRAMLQGGCRAEAGMRLLYLACNGAGKTTFTEQHPECVDTDAVVSAGSFHGVLHANSKNYLGLRSSTLLEFTEWLFVHAGVPAMTTQLDLATILRPHNQRSYTVRVIVVLPPFETIYERLQQRGWSLVKIRRRYTRFATIAAAVATSELLSPEERALVKFQENF